MNIHSIWIYPIKGLPGIRVPHWPLRDNGALAYDRQWAMVSANGLTINGKRTSKVQQPTLWQLMETLPVADGIIGPMDVIDLAEKLSDALGERVVLQAHDATGCPDDSDRPGPTVVAASTLESLGEKLDLSLREMIGRFRPNIVLDGLAPFADDLLVGKTLRMGGSTFHMAKLCNRCVVPTRDSHTGQVYEGFKDLFLAARKAGVSARVGHLFDHYYKLCINTIPIYVAQESVLAEGGAVEVTECGEQIAQ